MGPWSRLMSMRYASTDPFAVLRISRNSTSKELKKHFLRRAKTEHPDAGGDPESFKLLLAAFEDASRALSSSSGGIRGQRYPHDSWAPDTTRRSNGWQGPPGWTQSEFEEKIRDLQAEEAKVRQRRQQRGAEWEAEQAFSWFRNEFGGSGGKGAGQDKDH